jgi:adenine C2-methylase RlmN of 23S rRNA A2503 and tRNA A37
MPFSRLAAIPWILFVLLGMIPSFLRRTPMVASSFRPSLTSARRRFQSTVRLQEKKPSTPQQQSATAITSNAAENKVLNLSTVTLAELEDLVLGLQYPKYRAQQIHHYIRNQGVLDVDQMLTVPKKLREQLQRFSTTSSLQLVKEQVSRVDGTIKRVYQLHDGALIESVLMGPYQDGRYTACISSQVGCAQQCVFCATGQMGFSRQLTAAEIFEQVARFHAELLSSKDKTTPSTADPPPQHGKVQRLSNVVFMGMGEVRESVSVYRVLFMFHAHRNGFLYSHSHSPITKMS